MALPSKETHLKFPFLDLPQDIGRIVFEIAASLDPRTGASCALVSKKVKTWVETVLYRCIIIKQRKTLEYLSRTIRDPSSTKPPGFFASRVKSLAFARGSGIGGDVDSLTILKACQGVEWLHLWSSIGVLFRERKNFQKFITSPSITLSPRRLFIRDVLSNLMISHFGHAIFRNLTHLEVDMSDRWEWDTLRELNRLTHLSLVVDSDSEMDSRTVSRMVTQFSNSLKIVIFWAPDYLFGVRHTPGSEGHILDGDKAVEVMKSIQDGQTDQRAILGDGAGNLGARSERDPQWNLDRILAWESSNASKFYATRKDIWTLAEELIERRRLDLATSLRKLKHEQNSCPSHKPLLVHEGHDAPWRHLDDLGRYELKGEVPA